MAGSVRGPEKRSWTRVFATAMCAVVVLAAGIAVVPTPAAGESVTGYIEDTTPCPPNQSQYYCLGYAAIGCTIGDPVGCAAHAAFHTAFWPIFGVGVDEYNHVLGLTLHGIRRSFATDANDTIEPLLGEAFAQVERLTGLKLWYEVGSGPSVGAGAEYGSTHVYQRVEMPNAACVPPLCWPVFAAGRSSDTGGDSISKFQWNNSVIGVWDPDRESSPNSEGRAAWNLYAATEQPRIEFDFWATSQKASVRAVNGKKLEGVLQWIGPANENTEELIDWSPGEISEYGDAGSLTLGASLSTERVGNGASFSIGRTWNFSKGQVGGHASHAGDHILAWWKTSSSTSNPRSTNGVETWKTPAGADVSWILGAEAHVD